MEAWEQLPLFATQRALPANVRQRQRDQRLANDAEALARTFEGSGAHTMPDQEASLATIRALVAYGVPVRYVAGALDDKYGATADLVASQTPAVCHRVPAAGHNVHLEDAGAYVRLARTGSGAPPAIRGSEPRAFATGSARTRAVLLRTPGRRCV